MLTLHLDSQTLRVPEGATVLEAARAAGVFIPALCEPFPLPNGRKTPPQTSCMVCVVKVIGPGGAGRMMPSCALKVTDQMRVESDTAEVHKARRTALELLISDHEGPCVAPCQVVCPAHVHIDQMLAQAAAGNWRGAIAAVKQAHPFPATLGRLCPELCEKGCRRKLHDDAVSIGRLEREVADRDLTSPEPYRPRLSSPTGKRVAIIGGGPAGLTAAYYLTVAGHACTLFHRHAALGGSLLTRTSPAELPRDMLHAELAQIAVLPIAMRLGQVADARQLHAEYDAVLVATGDAAGAPKADRLTAMTAMPKVFVAGQAAAPCKHLVHAVADGQFAARAIDAFLMGRPPVQRRLEWSCLGTTPTKESIAARAADHGREARLDMPAEHVTEETACQQADRCLRCGCGKQDNCLLREMAARLDARPAAYRGQRHPAAPVLRARLLDGREVTLDNSKCIACGRCVAITREMGEPFGLTFLDRGFSTHIGPALGADLAQAMGQSADLCAAACPTAAIMVQ